VIMCKYWILRVRGIKLGLNTTEQNNKLRRQLQESDIEQINQGEDEINIQDNKMQRLKIARKLMRSNLRYKKELLTQHHKLRQQSLKENEEHHLQEGNKKAAKRAKMIARKEQSCQDWKNIKQAMKPSKRSGFSTLEAPDKDERGPRTDDPELAKPWRTVTDPKEIEISLLKRNIAHFGQVDETIFASPEFQKTLGYTGTRAQVT
jgi:hypothetical protein